MASQRIEYIDAMRGLTMILVIYSHVCRYCLGDWTMAGNNVLFLFRLPCFFFISGWLFGLVSLKTKEEIRNVISHKFMVQIVPTFIFLLLLARSTFFSRLGATKGGYWFTFALFEFFVIYIICHLAFRQSKHRDWWMLLSALIISVSAYCYDVYYNQLMNSQSFLTSHFSLFTFHFSLSDVLGFLSFSVWRYYLFFCIGALVRKHFDAFQRWIDKGWNVLLLLTVFVVMASIPKTDNVWIEYLRFALGGVSGMMVVFAFFRYFADFFSSGTRVGRGLIYVGTRTLDIYLLHYFFLPRFLLPVTTSHFSLFTYHFSLQVLSVLTISLVVLCLCLAASYIIRLNKTLGHYLFGVKYKS